MKRVLKLVEGMDKKRLWSEVMNRLLRLMQGVEETA
jgi:hypothetical protein